MEIKIDLEDMNKRQRKLFSTSVFLGKLLIAGIVFQAIIYLNPDTYSLQVWFAAMITLLLNLAGVEAVHEGILILLDTGVYRMIQDCLGWKSKAVFVGLMFASSSLRKHYRFMISGLVAIFLANIIRVFTTIYLSHLGIVSFEVIHGTLWRWGLTVVVLALWLYWFQETGAGTEPLLLGNVLNKRVLK